jgi:Icc-related predicted phosphoesterase
MSHIALMIQKPAIATGSRNATEQDCSMKCLLVADIHYDLRKFDWVVDVAEHFDLVVLAGDHLEIAAIVDRATQAVVVQKYFRRLMAKAPLIICSGNHDLDAKDANGELTSKWVTNARLLGIPTDGDDHWIGDTLFSVCPWWDGEQRQAAIGEQLARAASDRPGHWIWVYHAPPESSPTSWGGRRSFGDAPLRAWIEQYQPDIVLSGHVHQSPFIPNGSWVDQIGKTWVFNAGHQIGPIPAHIVVDTDAQRAYWLSLTAGETVSLEAPLTRPIDHLTEFPDWLARMAQTASRHLA